MDSTKPRATALFGLVIVAIVSVIARLTFLDGSLFDPAVAPGVGPFALGDLLAIVAGIAGFGIGYAAMPRHRRTWWFRARK
jgi:hypothetical protein